MAAHTETEYWHVIVSPKAGIKRPRSDAVAVDRDRDWIEDRILQPRREGEAIVLQGQTFDWNEIERVRITVSPVPSAELINHIKAHDRASQVAVLGGPSYEWRAAAGANDVTDDLIDAPAGTVMEQGAAPARVDPRRVMVVYGRDGEARRAMFDFLRALGLQPREWSQLVADTESAAPYIGQVLESAFEKAAAVVVLLTPDDEARLQDHFLEDGDPEYEGRPTPQARPNVLFEAGMAFGLHPDRTILVELGQLRPFSDLAGRHAVRLDEGKAALREIAKRLRTAGCDLDESGDDWADPERFPAR
ncbi:MAG: TIR domain-containing protein [Solirubrobacterales bacterium]